MAEPAPAPGNTDWAIMRVEGKAGQAVYRYLTKRPEGNLTILVAIAWNYSGSAYPPAEVRPAMDEFEDATHDPASGVMAMVITGTGRKEWSFYTGDYDAFMRELNASLSGKPRFPIAITYRDDPDWSYWWNVRKHAKPPEPAA